MREHENEELRAPWRLTGRGYLLVHWPKRGQAMSGGFIPEHLRSRFMGGPGAVMIIDYRFSNVGPYQELLYIPGAFRFGRRLRFSITRIFVSSEKSVTGGRLNWGIPKERADFEWNSRRDTDHVIVRAGVTKVADLRLEGLGPSMPASTALIPAGLRTLAHPFEGKVLCTAPEATFATRLARLLSAGIEPLEFPDFTRGRAVLATEITRFQMRFPPAMALPF